MPAADVDVERAAVKVAPQESGVPRTDARPRIPGRVKLIVAGVLAFALIVRCIHMLSPSERIPNALMCVISKMIRLSLVPQFLLLLVAMRMPMFCVFCGGDVSLHDIEIGWSRARMVLATMCGLVVVCGILGGPPERAACEIWYSGSNHTLESSFDPSSASNINSDLNSHMHTQTYSTVEISRTCEALAPICSLGQFSVLVDGPHALIQDSTESDSLDGPVFGSNNSSLAIALERPASNPENQTFALRVLDAEIVYNVSARTAHASFGTGVVVSAWDALGHELSFARADATPDGDAKPLKLLADGLVLDLLAVLGRERSVVTPYSVPTWDAQCAAFCVDRVSLGRPLWEVLNARVLTPLGLFMLRTYDVHVYQKDA